MCAALSPLQSDLCIEENSAFHRGQSRASMSCLCRPSRACIFLFLPIPASLSRLSKVEAKPLFSHLGLAAAPGFVHNRPTRLQRGWSGASLVSFPYPVPKTAHRAAQGLFSLLRSLLHFSPTGKSWADLEPVLLWVAWIRPQAAHTGPTGLVWGFASAVPLPGPQNRTQALTGASWGYLFFLVCFCSGRSANSFSSL